MAAFTVRVPTPLDLTQQRLSVGDTFQFITKINVTQEKFEAFSSELTTFVNDLQQLADVSNLAIETAEAAAQDLQTVRDYMDVNLNPALEAALERIREEQPVTEEDLHAHALYF